MIREEKIKLLAQLADEIRACNRCVLHSCRKKAVPGFGNVITKILFVAEAPGREEDEQGLPFVGKSGKLLDSIFEELGHTRRDFFITNLIKCRPPNNRDPEDSEIEKCFPYIEKQIEILSPQIIVTLGRYSTRVLLKTDERISSLRGNVYEKDNFKIMPTFHPAYILRNNNYLPILKKDIEKAIRTVEV